jgi:hypothetical protein
MSYDHQQQHDTTFNTRTPIVTATLAIPGPFFFINLFTFALELPPLSNGAMSLSAAGLESAR